MEVRKLYEYRNPSYPDHSAVSRDPNLLKTLPERWKRNAAACAALAATSAMLLTSCQSQPKPSGGNGNLQTTAPASPTPSPSPTPTPVVERIAVPLFEHGTGRGSFGCVSVAPPAFLSEQEAFEIISEIAEKEGLKFQKDAVQIDGVELPQTNIYAYPAEAMKYKKGPLLLDGVSENEKVAFEFVSTEDIESWKQDVNMMSSVSEYDFIGTAKALSGDLNKKAGDMAVAVFYDPHYNYSSAEAQQIIKDNQDKFEVMEQKLKELVKEDLRAQVRDFIAWLKAEGII